MSAPLQDPFPGAPVEVFSPGAVLLRRAKPSDCAIYVEKGRVLLGILDPDGCMAHQLGVIQGPGWLDATAVILNLPSLVDYVAETGGEVRNVPLSQFQTLVSQSGSGEQSLLVDVVRAHRQQMELAVSRVAKNAEARCAEWLLRHAEPGTCAVRLQPCKRLIAAQLGIAPETLSRVLRHLRERSLISGSGRVVQMVDMRGLQALADH